MRSIRLLVCYCTLGCLILSSPGCVSHDSGSVVDTIEPVDLVDPLIGTGSSTTISAQKHSEADNEPRGQTMPAVGFPFGMTQWTPQTHHTETKCISPYYFGADSINGFRGSHWMSGSCTQDYGSVTLMPQTGSLVVDPEQRKTSFSRSDEIVQPYYYSVSLPQERVAIELAGHERSGILRLRFETTDSAFVLIEPNSDEGVGYVQINAERNEITGYNPAHRIYQGWGDYAGFNGYFVAQFDQPFAAYGTWESGVLQDASTEAQGDSTFVGAFVRFEANSELPVYVKVGTSFTSIDAARANLEAEIPGWNFEAVKQASKDAWNRGLSAIRVTVNNNGTYDALVQFYTAHYHAMMLPRQFSDVSGSYPEFAGSGAMREASDFTYYADFSVWDTYRAVHPLLTITSPDRTQDMVQSLIAKAEQGGWLPIFPSWNNYTSAMIGDHVTSIIADAYTKGLTGFDAEKAYQYMYQNATQTPTYDEYVDGKGRRALLPYLEYKYIPLEEPITEAFHREEQVSRTLEYAYDDFMVAIMAVALGYQEDADKLLERALYYRNIVDPETGIVRGRYRDGTWFKPFDPKERTYEFITEGSPWHYTWYVPHDVAGLIDLMGGPEVFIERLDTLFDEGEYWHGNEPGHQVPYLYAYAGAPWKTQQRIREILAEEYSSGPGGLSGNDDAGQMSAWYVFSTLGFYPVSPGLPYYVIGTPFFPEVELRVDDGNVFTIRALQVSEANVYIQSASLNGNPLHRSWITHDEVMAGGLLEFQMGAEPNEAWASDLADAPPSLSTGLGRVMPDFPM